MKCDILVFICSSLLFDRYLILAKGVSAVALIAHHSIS
jgi:hypothetical protein